jgi:hypothetical protein
MNTLQLIQDQGISFEYIASQPTIGQALQSLQNSDILTRGDKLSARMQSKTAQVSSNDGFTPLSTTEETNSVSLSSEAPSENPLKRTTYNYSKLKQEEINKQVQKDFKDLGIEVL